jgi:hypothetical protein
LQAGRYTIYWVKPGEGLTPMEELAADDKVAFNCTGAPDAEAPAFLREFWLP